MPRNNTYRINYLNELLRDLNEQKCSGRWEAADDELVTVFNQELALLRRHGGGHG